MLTRRDRHSSPVLRITTRHPFFYTHLLTSETPRHFLMTAHADHHTHVSSGELFERIFTPPKNSPSLVTWDQRLAETLRRQYLLFLLGFSTKAPSPDILNVPPPHFIHHRPNTRPLTLWQRLMLLRIIAAEYYIDKLEEWIMWRVGARFVQGQEPWGVWARAVDNCWRDVRGAEQGIEGLKWTGLTPEEEEMDRVWGSIVVKEGETA